MRVPFETFVWEGARYTKVVPAKTLFRSTMIHEVVNRGDFFAVNIDTHVLTILPKEALSVDFRYVYVTVNGQTHEYRMFDPKITLDRMMEDYGDWHEWRSWVVYCGTGYDITPIGRPQGQSAEEFFKKVHAFLRKLHRARKS